MTRLLVTGFGPFPRMPRNPSAAVARAAAAVPRLRLHGIEAKAAVLTTAYATLTGELDPLLAERPDIVILVGVAGRSAKVRVEERATARRSTLFPDRHGDVPQRPEARAPARVPSARLTRVNAVVAMSALRHRGLPARRSRDAGRYLCNAAYFRALDAAAPTLFVHIPKRPVGRRTGGGRGRLVGGRWQAALAAALAEIAIGLLPQARRVVRGATVR